MKRIGTPATTTPVCKPDIGRSAGLNLRCHTIESSHNRGAVVKFLRFLKTGATWLFHTCKFLQINKNGAALQRSVTQLVPRLSKRRNNGASPAFHPAVFFPCRVTSWGTAGAFPKTANGCKHQTTRPTGCRTESALSRY